MALPSSPPRYASWADLVAPIKLGESGWRPFALQKALVQVGGQGLTADGAFGPQTEAAVKRFQSEQGLLADGVAGAKTQARLLSLAGTAIHSMVPDIPDGLMRGFAEGEGANVLTATNWSQPGGVDCGSMQLRVYGPPYDTVRMSKAFSVVDAMLETGLMVRGRAKGYMSGAWVRSNGARALRCAVLAHNWPAGADYYADVGHAPNPTAVATWVASGTHFPDGKSVITRQEWAEFYAMGGVHGEGAIVRYVTAWN